LSSGEEVVVETRGQSDIERGRVQEGWGWGPD